MEVRVFSTAPFLTVKEKKKRQTDLSRRFGAGTSQGRCLRKVDERMTDTGTLPKDGVGATDTDILTPHLAEALQYRPLGEERRLRAH